MLFTELLKVYEVLEENGSVSFGWNTKGPVDYGIDIDRYGKFFQIIPFVDENKKPRYMSVPASTKKETGTGVFNKFAYGKSKYLLGYTTEKDKNKDVEFVDRTDFFKHTRDYHIHLLKNVDSEPARAILDYFTYYSDHHDELINMIDWNNHREYENAYFMLCYEGIPVLEYPEIKAVWEKEFPRILQEESDYSGLSLLSGKKVPIARTHNSVLVSGGSNPSIISFNEESSESYDLIQSYNAAISVEEALRYTTALNYMLKDNDYNCFFDDTTVVMWAGNAAPAYSKFGNILIMGNMQNDLPLDQSELRKLTKDISRGEKVDFNGFPLDPKEPFFITGLRARKGRIQLDFYFENSFGEFIQNINLHYERMQLNDEKSKNLSPTEIIKETVRDIEKANRSLKGSLLTSVLKNTRYLDEIFTGVLNRIRKGPDKKRKEKSKVTNRIQKGPDKARYETTKVTTRKAQVLKMYLSKNSQSSKEVTGLEININAKSIGYQCGRLFAVLEKIQKDATNVENLSSKHFNAAMATPGNAFAKVLRLNQYYVKKLNDSSKIYYDRLIQEIMNHIPEFPKHLSQIEQGEFCLGYYHQKQELYKKKDNKEVENNA